MAVVTEAELEEVEWRLVRHVLQLIFVAAASRREVLALHWHRMDVRAWNLHALYKQVGQLRKVPVFTAGRSYALINLEYVHPAPWHGKACQRLEHERRGSSSTEAERILA